MSCQPILSSLCNGHRKHRTTHDYFVGSHLDQRIDKEEAISHLELKRLSLRRENLYDSCCVPTIFIINIAPFISANIDYGQWTFSIPSRLEHTKSPPFLHRVEIQTFGSGTSVAAHVAKTKDVVRDKTSNKDPRYPEGIHGVVSSILLLILHRDL